MKIEVRLMLAGLEKATENILEDATVTEVLELHLRIEAQRALYRLAVVHRNLNLFTLVVSSKSTTTIEDLLAGL